MLERRGILRPVTSASPATPTADNQPLCAPLRQEPAAGGASIENE